MRMPRCSLRVTGLGVNKALSDATGEAGPVGRGASALAKAPANQGLSWAEGWQRQGKGGGQCRRKALSRSLEAPDHERR